MGSGYKVKAVIREADADRSGTLDERELKLLWNAVRNVLLGGGTIDHFVQFGTKDVTNCQPRLPVRMLPTLVLDASAAHCGQIRAPTWGSSARVGRQDTASASRLPDVG